MLSDKSIISRQNYPTEIGFLKGIDLVLTEKNYMSGEEKKVIYKKVIWQNEYYILGEIEKINVAKDLQKY